MIPSRIVLNPTAQPATSQSVTWRTDESVGAGFAEIAPAAGGPAVTVEADSGLPVRFTGWEYSSRHHTALFTGLSPDTEYRYRVGKDPDWSGWKTFRTASDGSKPWEMVYFGDAQNGLDTVWPTVASRAYSSLPNARVHLHAGDLINNSDNDVQWGDWFAAVDGHADRLMTLPVVGNHERSGDPLFTQFSQHFETPGNGPALARNTVYSVDYQGVRFIVLDGNGTDLFGQEAFLKTVLADNPNRWTVVSFHQPIFAGAAGRDNPVARAILLPILEEHNVDLVLQGHDHVYARGHVTANETGEPGIQTGPVYTVAVAGSKYYDLAPAEANNWTENGATRAVAFNQTSTYQSILFGENHIEFRSFIGAKGAASTAPGAVGDLLDAFTISRLPDGSKIVAEGEEPPNLHPDPDPAPKARTATLKVRKVLRIRKNGTARVTLAANLAGRLKVSGKGIRKVSKKLKADKPVTVRIRTNAVRTRTLRRKGRFAVKVNFSFRADNGKTRKVSRRILLLGKKR